jgi:hypothetical protein
LEQTAVKWSRGAWNGWTTHLSFSTENNFANVNTKKHNRKNIKNK